MLINLGSYTCSMFPRLRVVYCDPILPKNDYRKYKTYILDNVYLFLCM